MFDPANLKNKRAAQEEQKKISDLLREWSLDCIPTKYHNDLEFQVKEIACNDPSCAPIDSVFIMVWTTGGGMGLFSLPLPMKDITQTYLKEKFPV